MKKSKTAINGLTARTLHLEVKYNIIGAEKCGSTSLEIYLNQKGYKTIRNEGLMFRENAVSRYKKWFPNYQPIVILRDPVERVFSDWYYRRYVKPKYVKRGLIYCDFEEALEIHPELIQHSQYDIHLKNWYDSGYPLIIYHLEDLKKIKDFPRANESNKPKMTDKQRSMIESLLNKS